MPIVSFRDEYFDILEEFYKANIGLTTKLQYTNSLDDFIEEMAMLGLEKYRKNLSHNPSNNGQEDP